MRVIDIAGRLQTAGTWDETAQAEAAAQARLRATRAGLRRMIDGNEAFHVDPMAAPVMSAACNLCGQHDHGQYGEYPCKKCGLPMLHDDPATAPSVPLTVPKREPEVWRAGAPPVPGVYVADLCRLDGSMNEGAEIWRRRFDGVSWSAVLMPDGSAASEGRFDISCIRWLCLDREWRLVAKGRTVRDAIRAAMKEKQQ